MIMCEENQRFDYIEERLDIINEDISDIHRLTDIYEESNKYKFERIEKVISELIAHIDKLQDEVNQLHIKVKELESK